MENNLFKELTLTNDKGEVIDSSKNHGPLSYIQGFGNIIPGLETAMEGKSAGDAFKVSIAPKDAYGDLTGLSPKSLGEDGQFKYRRLPKDSYKQGIITDVRQMGGYPEYKGTPYVDTDKDGMPDEWEIANGLNPNDPSDANKDCTGDGYTNIEKYINGISTKHKVDWRDMKNNYDTLAEKGKLM